MAREPASITTTFSMLMRDTLVYNVEVLGFGLGTQNVTQRYAVIRAKSPDHV